MSTSLLYHAFGLRAYKYETTKYEGGVVAFCVSQSRDRLRCSECGSADVFFERPRFASFPDRSHRFQEDPNSFQVKIGFADSKKSYTHAFARYVLELSRHITLAAVAVHLGVGWDLIKGIQKDYLQRHFSRPKLKSLKRIAIDEIYVGHRHRFLTIVLDLESGAIVFVGDGKGQNALRPFWKRLRHARAEIEAVAADLSPAYGLAIRTHLPDAVLVFDRFHLVNLLNEHLTDLRRELHREAEIGLNKSVLKGTRWLLLKHSANLDDTRGERERLEEALALNKPLATAYYLKEDLCQIWEQPTKRIGEFALDFWIRRAERSGIQQLQKFAKTLRTHRNGILAWYDHRISTGPLEGTNNKIKLLQRQAFGYRDLDFFKLKLLALHYSQHALVG